MKKFTLFAIAMLVSAVSFAALNPFAYALSSTLSADETTLTVNYSLNADATSVKVVLLDGETVLKTVDCAALGLTQGAYTTTIPTADLPKAKSLTWKVEVNGTSVEVPTQETKMYNMYCPHGLAIDKDPESEYFGRILVADAMDVVKDKAGYLGSGIGAGLHAFNPSFTTDSVVYKGGNDFTRILATNGYQPWRVKISEDGRIFVSSLDLNGVVVWEVSKDLQTWTPVIAGTNDATDHNIYDADGNFVAGLNCSMDVTGKGEDLKLLLYSTNNKGIAFNQSGYRLDEYALGTATTWTGTPKNILEGGKLGLVHTNVEFIYDGEGGYWFGGSRAGNAGQPNLVHINAAGEQDYYSEDASLYGGDGVLVHNGMLFKGKARTSGTVGNFGVWTIGKDADGKVTLTEKWTVVADGIGRNLNEFAVDYADNLYIVGNSGEKIIAYALPYSGKVETPAASKYAFQLQESVEGTFYTLTVNVDETKGSVAGNNVQYAEGATATLTATANEGYKFLNWTVGEETLTDNPLTLTITSDITVTANFEALTAYTVTATVNDETLGTVAGAGTYYAGATITLTATANTGAQFINWTVGEETLTDNPLTLTADKDYTVVANFEVLKYDVVALTNDETKGTVEGAGSYTYGETVTVTATPAEGYKFLSWSDRTTDNPVTITVDGNKVLNAYFVKAYDEEPTYTIEKLWENTNVPAATTNGYQAVGWDGKIYVQDAGNTKIVTYSSAEDTGTDYATSGSGQQIAVDEAGNLIVFNAWFATGTPNAILIYQKGSTEGKAVSFTLPQPGRCDFFTASGDIYSAEGGYVYFYCQNKTVVNRLKIANGAATEADVTVDVVGQEITAGNSQNHVMVDIFGNLVAVSRSNAASWINVYTNESSKTFAATLSGIKLSTLGGCSFELGGKELWAYNVGSTAYNSEWNLYNLTDEAFLSETALYAKNTTDKNAAANWLNVQVVDEKTAYIYQFCPKVAVAVWKVTCTVSEKPGVGTDVENTIVAPRAQKILRDGQVLIIRDGKIYNTMGQEIR